MRPQGAGGMFCNSHHGRGGGSRRLGVGSAARGWKHDRQVRQSLITSCALPLAPGRRMLSHDDTMAAPRALALVCTARPRPAPAARRCG